MEIWEPKPPGTLWATPGLLRDCFTFTFYRLIGKNIYCPYLHGRLKIEAAGCAETFIHIYQTVQLHIPLDHLKPLQLFMLDLLQYTYQINEF